MVVSGGRSRLQRGVPLDDRILHIPARCSQVRVQLQSLDFTETHHDIIKLQYTKHEVHTASCNAAAVDCKASYGLSDRRRWRDGAVDCCLPSIGYDYWRKYWANNQYHPIPASIGQYPILQYRYRSNPTCYSLFSMTRGSCNNVLVWQKQQSWTQYRIQCFELKVLQYVQQYWKVSQQ